MTWSFESIPGFGRVDRDGLVEIDLVAKSARARRTNEYALTEAGHEAIVDQLSWVVSRFVTTEARAATVMDLIPAAQQ